MSSDDDLQHLPGFGGPSRRKAPPRRIRNFQAMLADSSDEEVGNKPTIASKQPAARKTLDAVQAPPRSPSVSSEDSTTGSIMFVVEKKANPEPTPPKPVAKVATEPQQPVAIVAAPPTPQPIHPTPQPIQQPVPQQPVASQVVAPPQPATPQQPLPMVQPEHTPVHQHTVPTYLHTAPPSPAPMPESRPPQTPPPSSHYDVSNRLSRPPMSDVDDVLARAQQRLREKRDGSRAPSPVVARAASFSGRAPSPNTTGGSSRVEAGGGGVQLPDDSRESRMRAENKRLIDEVSFLAKENKRLKGLASGTGASAGATAVEVSKLQLQLEVVSRQGREAEADGTRERRRLEQLLNESEEHRRALQGEVESFTGTLSQYQLLVKEKESQSTHDQAALTKLRSEAAELGSEVRRLRDDNQRREVDGTSKLERVSSMLDDAKRQRAHLMDLNDQLSKDKEQAVAERRRVYDELRTLQLNSDQEREQMGGELHALRLDIERYKGLLVDKERALSSQVNEERKAKEYYHGKLLEMEETTATDTRLKDSRLRNMQEEQRALLLDLQDKLQNREEEATRQRSRADKLQSELEIRGDREQQDAHRLYGDRTQVLRKEKEELQHEVGRATTAKELLLRECDRLRMDLSESQGAIDKWKVAKERAEAQNLQLATSLKLLMENDDEKVEEFEALRAELEGAQEVVRRQAGELEQTYGMEANFQSILSENERLSAECGRLARERDDLVEENGQMAHEITKWRKEVRDMLATAGSKGPTAKRYDPSSAVSPTSRLQPLGSASPLGYR